MAVLASLVRFLPKHPRTTIQSSMHVDMVGKYVVGIATASYTQTPLNKLTCRYKQALVFLKYNQICGAVSVFKLLKLRYAAYTTDRVTYFGPEYVTLSVVKVSRQPIGLHADIAH